MKRTPALVLTGLAVAGLTIPSTPALAVEVPPQPTNLERTSNLSTKDPRLTESVLQLAEGLGVPASQVHVYRYNEGYWSNGASGCPQPGYMYTMALRYGHELVLEVDGNLYLANGSEKGYCSTPSWDFHPSPKMDTTFPA